MARVRDMQRSRIFEAEEAFKQANPLTTRPQWLIDRITRRVWWSREMHKLGRSPFSIDAYQSGRYGPARECIPTINGPHGLFLHVSDPTSVSPLEILHSLSHVLVGHRPTTQLPHEPDFVNQYLNLVGRFYDRQTNLALRRGFKAALMKEGVRTKAVSDATREKMRASYESRRTPPSQDELLQMLKELKEL